MDAKSPHSSYGEKVLPYTWMIGQVCFGLGDLRYDGWRSCDEERKGPHVEIVDRTERWIMEMKSGRGR